MTTRSRTRRAARRAKARQRWPAPAHKKAPSTAIDEAQVLGAPANHLVPPVPRGVDTTPRAKP